MIDIPARALLLGAAGAILASTFPTTATAAAKRPQLRILCLPPGGTSPMPCSIARRGSIFEVAVPGGTAGHLVFSEVDPVGPPRIVRVPLARGPGPGSAVRLGVPPQLCAYDSVERWRVRLVTGPARRTSIGAVTVRC